MTYAPLLTKVPNNPLPEQKQTDEFGADEYKVRYGTGSLLRSVPKFLPGLYLEKLSVRTPEWTRVGAPEVAGIYAKFFLTICAENKGVISNNITTFAEAKTDPLTSPECAWTCIGF